MLEIIGFGSPLDIIKSLIMLPLKLVLVLLQLTFDDGGVFRDSFKLDKDIIVKATNVAMQPIWAPVVVILFNLFRK